MSKQGSFYEQMRRSEKIKEFRDPLNEIGSRVNFEAFRGALEKALGKQAKGPGGRPRFDSVLMFKILVVGVLYNVSDDALEMRIYDSAFVQKFLGIESTDRIPDAKTIWAFRELLTKEGAMEYLFKGFNELAKRRANGLTTNRSSARRT